jgi:hypothetical protein
MREGCLASQELVEKGWEGWIGKLDSNRLHHKPLPFQLHQQAGVIGGPLPLLGQEESVRPGIPARHEIISVLGIIDLTQEFLQRRHIPVKTGAANVMAGAFKVDNLEARICFHRF